MADWGGEGLQGYQQNLQNEFEAGQRERDRHIATGEAQRRATEWEESKRKNEAQRQREATLVRQHEARADKKAKEEKRDKTLEGWAKSTKEYSEKDFSRDKTTK